MKILLKTISIILSILICFFIAILGNLTIPPEGYNLIKPDIDTEFSKNYTEEGFNNIKIGMDTIDVVKILGSPLGVEKLNENRNLWYFSNDGKCEWGDFAWLGREIYFNEKGKVTSKEKIIHYD